MPCGAAPHGHGSQHARGGRRQSAACGEPCNPLAIVLMLPSPHAASCCLQNMQLMLVSPCAFAWTLFLCIKALLATIGICCCAAVFVQLVFCNWAFQDCTSGVAARTVSGHVSASACHCWMHARQKCLGLQDLLDESGITWPVMLSMSRSGIAKRMFILEKIGTIALTVQEQACTFCSSKSFCLCCVDLQLLPDCDVEAH